MKIHHKIKVLQAIRQGQIGGGETHVLELVKNLDPSVFETQVLAFTDGPMIERLNEMEIKTHVVKTLRPFDFMVWNQVKKIMLDNNFQIIHAHGTRAASNVFNPTKLANIPLIYTVHGWSFHKQQNIFIRNIKELSEQYLTNKASVTINVSLNNQIEGINKFGLNNSQLIYNGIDLNKFNPELNHPNIKTELKIPQNKTLVGYIARMTNQKDPLTLIKSIAEVKKTSQDILFLIVGNGELLGLTKKLAAELNLNDQIIFCDFRTDIPAILNAIDIYTLPSLWEGLPIGLMEAMAMGKPCLATGVDGTKELINHNVNGILFDIKDYRELAKLIIYLHNNPEKRNSMGKMAIETIKEKYCVSTMVKKTQNVYLKTLEQKLQHKNKK